MTQPERGSARGPVDAEATSTDSVAKVLYSCPVSSAPVALRWSGRSQVQWQWRATHDNTQVLAAAHAPRRSFVSGSANKIMLSFPEAGRASVADLFVDCKNVLYWERKRVSSLVCHCRSRRCRCCGLGPALPRKLWSYAVDCECESAESVGAGAGAAAAAAAATAADQIDRSAQGVGWPPVHCL